MKRHIAMAALALLCALQLTALLRAPAAHHPARVTLALEPGQAMALSARELGLPSTGQLALRRAADGSWHLGADRPVVLWRDGEPGRTGGTRLRAGQRLQIGQALFTVEQAGDDGLAFRGGGHHWRYDGARVLRDGVIQPPCPDSDLRATWNRWAPRLAAFKRPLAFGGNLHCANRIGIPFTEPASATVRDLTLSATMPILVDGLDPAAGDTPLSGLDALGIGRARLALRPDGKHLHLQPQRDVALFADTAVPLPDGVSWEWRRRGLWDLPGVSGPALLLLFCAAVLAARRFPAAIPAAVAIAGVAAMAMQRAGAAPGIGIAMLLGWAALWCFLCQPRRPGLATGAGILLLALGLLSQLELGLGAASTGWARHVQKSCALLAIGLGAGGVLRLRAGPLPARLQVEYVLAAMALAALLALGLQVAAGDETGVFGLQPVEFAKLALAALAAHCIAVGLGALPEKHGAAMRWFRVAAPALLLAGLCALALAQVNDYSPLLLLLLWCAGLGLAWAAVTRRPALAAAMVAACLLAAAAIAALRGADAGQLAQWGFYADRFEVWLDPAGHPHTGQQMLLAGRAIAQGGWWGALGQDAAGVLAIPAVQDDFAPTFFLNRHGLAAGLLLWMLQAAFLVGLLHTALQAHARAAGARDFRLAWLGRFQCLFLAGAAAFVFGHLLLSWGTNLAILPIMGQPMSFLSSGGSHLLFFICPLLTFDAIAASERTAHHRRVDHAGLRTT